MRLKKTSIKKLKKGFYFNIIFISILILVSFIFLMDHLFQVQKFARLAIVEDYTNFILSYESPLNCQKEIIEIYRNDKEVYNGICISKIFIHYGGTKITLEEALNGGYITKKDIIKKMGNVDEISDDNIMHYEYRRSTKNNENYFLTLQKKEYQKLKLDEITFERIS